MGVRYTAEQLAAIGKNKPAAARLPAAEAKALFEKPKRSSKPVKQSETANQITKNALLWLNLNGFKAWRVNNGSIYDVKRQSFRKNPNALNGIPDIGGYELGTGRALYIEVKAGKDKLSPEQIRFLEDAEHGGAICGVIRQSREIEEIINRYKTTA